VLSQYCIRDDPSETVELVPCPNPSETLSPVIEYFAPTKLFRPEDFTEPCPYMDKYSDLCCNDDQVQILSNINYLFICIVYNFMSLDAVFGDDCPVCSANLKKLWCSYTCDPNKINFGKFCMILMMK
jgi:hypothetical protein